jgi:hypothetical protein
MEDNMDYRKAMWVVRAVVVAAITAAAVPAMAVVDGYKIYNEANEVLIHEFNGSIVEGDEIVVPPGGSTEALTVEWLDENDQPINPATLPSPQYSLEVQIDDTGIVTSTPLGQFVFRLNAVVEDFTFIRLCLKNNAVCQFTGQDVECHVESPHFEADGAVFRQNGQVVVHIWQGVVTGSIDVWLGQTTVPLDVSFFDADSVESVPSDNPDFSLQLENDTPAIASITPAGDWSFRSTGKQTGSGTMRICLHHVDHCDFTTPNIPVHVQIATPVGDTPLPALSLRAVPNPFAGSTRLELTMEREAPVRVAVYDVAGRLVRTLHDGRKAAGVHSFALDGQGLTSGVYFVRAVTGLGTSVQKIVLAR